MRAVVLLLGALFAQAISFSQTTVSVRVTDPTGAPVPNASGSLSSVGGHAPLFFRTSGSGEYSSPPLPEGEYLLEVTAPGFERTGMRRVLTEAANPAKVEIQLGLPSVQTRVQVTAIGIPQTIDEQAKALDTVDASRIESRAEHYIAESIRQLPGIRVQQLGGPGSFFRILVRGLRSSDTSVLIDGVRLRDPAAPQGDASAFAGDLLTGDTARVEVLRGSGSSLYGTHATGGVINVITDTGGGPFHGELGADGGGLGLGRGLFRFGGGARENRLHYSAALTHVNSTRGIDGDDRSRNSAAHGLIGWRPGARTTITARLLASDSFAQLNDSPFAATGLPANIDIEAIPGQTYTPAPNDPDSRRTAHHASTVLSLSHTLSPSGTLKASYHGFFAKRDALDGPGGQVFEPLFNNSNVFSGRIDTVLIRTDWSVGRSNLITAGYEAERESFENLSTDQNPVVSNRVNALLNITQRSQSLFAQDQIRLLDNRLNISLSGRTQWFALSDPRFSGSTSPYGRTQVGEVPKAWVGDASVAYFSPRSGTKLRGHVGNSYRAPAMFERYGASFFFGSFSAFGDPGIAPERVLSVDGGVDQYFANSRVRFSATYFYARLQETIFFDFSGAIEPSTDPYGRFGGYRNTGGGLSRGAEVSVEAALGSSGSVTAAYTFTNADEQRSLFTSGNLRSVRVSDHMLTTTLTQRFGKRFDTSFDLFAASDYLYVLSSRPFRFEAPLKADAAISYTVPLSDSRSLRLYTRVENLLNRTYYEEGFRTPKAWAIFGMKLLF